MALKIVLRRLFPFCREKGIPQSKAITCPLHIKWSVPYQHFALHNYMAAMFTIYEHPFQESPHQRATFFLK